MDLIKDENIKMALKRQVPHLIDFLVDHIDEVADIALGVTVTDFPMAQDVCFSLIVTQMHSLTSLLVVNPIFLARLNEFITKQEKLTLRSAAAFSRILQFLIQTSDCAVLNRFPESECLFKKILKHMSFASITNLLVFITDAGRPTMISFLEDNKAIDVLLGFVCDDPDVNEKLFLFMANIVGAVKYDSPLLSPFENSETVAYILNLALKSTPHVSSKVFNLLFEVAAQCDSEEEDPDDPLYSTVFNFLISRIQDICNFVLSDKPFLEDKASAIELINMILVMPLQVPQCVVDLCGALFDQMFEHPANTFLHKALLSVFGTIALNKEQALELVDKVRMRQRIAEAFKKKDEIGASYWGILYDLSMKIFAKLDGNQVRSEWKDFVKGTLAETKEVLESEYGGPVPDDDMDIDYDEEPVFPLGKSQLAAMSNGKGNR